MPGHLQFNSAWEHHLLSMEHLLGVYHVAHAEPLLSTRSWFVDIGIRKMMSLPGCEAHGPVIDTDFFPTINLTSANVRRSKVYAKPLFWMSPLHLDPAHTTPESSH